MDGALTIPKTLTKKGDLVIIPRIEYEEYLNLKKIVPLIKLSKIEKKRVEQGRKEIRSGQSLALEQLRYELGH